MAEESRTNPDDSQGIELSESELKELQRLEAKKKASQKKVLDSKDNLFGAVLADLDLEGLDRPSLCRSVSFTAGHASS